MKIITILFILLTRYWLPITLFNLAAITLLSLLPLEHLPPAPGGDKTHHIMAYAILIFPAAFAKVKFHLILAGIFILLGAVIEYLQPYVNRHAEYLDLLANTAGILLGLIMGTSLAWLYRNSVDLK